MFGLIFYVLGMLCLWVKVLSLETTVKKLNDKLEFDKKKKSKMLDLQYGEKYYFYDDNTFLYISNESDPSCTNETRGKYEIVNNTIILKDINSIYRRHGMEYLLLIDGSIVEDELRRYVQESSIPIDRDQYRKMLTEIQTRNDFFIEFKKQDWIIGE